jgi:ketosteroid isomerase-like protein
MPGDPQPARPVPHNDAIRGLRAMRKPPSLMTSDANRALLETFFAAFSARDGAGMSRCYDSAARFRDPVFELEGARIGAMWRMLCSRGADLRIEASDLSIIGDTGSATWHAWYTFSASGRPVHNIVNSRFRFRDGRIIDQVDRFSFWRWSRQALGPAGLLLGWTPLLRRKVQTNADRALQAHIRSEAAA